MSCACEVEEAFFDTSDHFMFGNDESAYDIWLTRPLSIKERRRAFLTGMGFTECLNSWGTDTMRLETIPCTVSDDKLSCERRQKKSNSEANCLVDSCEHASLDDLGIPKLADEKGRAGAEEKKEWRWWKQLTRKMKKRDGYTPWKAPKSLSEDQKMTRIRTEHSKKKFKECTAVYSVQKVHAHKGLIWCLKFSPDGQYLASGGEDGVVCIWQITTKSCFGRNKLSNPGLVIPDMTFHIEEEPLRMFCGHGGDVLDLAWSNSNHLLSSSVDKTVRLWHVDSERCLGVFEHTNYVTCVQFNPEDENYFISGALDGKVRIWGLSKRRVQEWADVGDIVTAICYQPDGKGFIAGSVCGTCCFYETIGDELLLKAEIEIHGRTKSSRNKITGIQFLRGKSPAPRVMITSEDSKIRILEGLEVVHKYRGLSKSGAQTSALFTSNGKHFISVGEDSHIYMWNYDELLFKASKKANSTRSFEHFQSKGVSVAIPWSNVELGRISDIYISSSTSSNYYHEAASRAAGSDCFTLPNHFLTGRSSKASITWPEEKLPMQSLGSRTLSSTWGLVFVTGNVDGTIRTFHNFGLPCKA